MIEENNDYELVDPSEELNTLISSSQEIENRIKNEKNEKNIIFVTRTSSKKVNVITCFFSCLCLPWRLVNSLLFSDESYSGATFNFVNGAVGIGILMLPYVFFRCGVVFGTIFLLVSGIISAIAQYLLYECYVYCRKIDPTIKDYEELGKFHFGTFCSISVQICNFLNCISCCVSYCIILGDLLDRWILISIYRDLTLFAIISPVIIASMFEKVTSIRFVSYFSVLSTVVFVLFIIILYFSGATRFQRTGYTVYYPDLSIPSTYLEMFSILGIVIFSFDNSTIICNICCEYSDKNVHKVGISILAGSVFMFVLYCSIAEFGYLSFLHSTHSDIIKSYSGLGWYENVLCVILGLSMIFTFPLALFPARYTLVNIINDLFNCCSSSKKKKKKEEEEQDQKQQKTTEKIRKNVSEKEEEDTQNINIEEEKYKTIVIEKNENYENIEEEEEEISFSKEEEKKKKKKKKKILRCCEIISNIILTLLLGIFCFIIAVVFPYVADIVNLVGGTLSVATIYFFPCMFYLRTLWMKKTSCFHPKFISVVLLMVFGCFIGCSVTIISIINTIRDGTMS